MAERSGRREAGFARIYLPPVLRGQPREINAVGFNSLCACKNLLRYFDEPEALGHFPWTGMLGTGRAVDEKDRGRTGRVLMPLLGRFHRLVSRNPIDGQIVVRIG